MATKEKVIVPAGKNYSGVNKERAIDLVMTLINDEMAKNKTNNATVQGEWIAVKEYLRKNLA